MASYSTQVRADIARWQTQQLIDPETAERLLRDVAMQKRRGINFGAILAILASLLLGAAVLLFIAANWEAMPRLVRAALLFALIGGGYVGGAVAKMRGASGWGEALWLLAAIAFGASLALIGQMYHLSGDEAQAIAIWGIGTALAAAILRSPALTAGAVVLAVAWTLMDGGIERTQASTTWSFLGALILLWALSFWTRSPQARSLILLALLLHGWMHFLNDENQILVIFMAASSAALFAFAVARPTSADRFLAVGSQLPHLALFGFLVSMGLLQVSLSDDVLPALLAAAVTLSGIVAALLAGGTESRRVRHLAYAGFGAELIYIYVQYLGSMLGSASFFLAAGLVLAVIAVIIRRFERRFAAEATGDAT